MQTKAARTQKAIFFLVTVILKDSQQLPQLYKLVEDLEASSGRKKFKWHKSTFTSREAYLLGLLEIKELTGSVFYSSYGDSKKYIPLLSITIAKSILSQNYRDYSAAIVIDGLKEAEVEYARRELKTLRIHYRKIRGMKDEQDALLRLADSMAGFLRDYKEGFGYAKKLFQKFAELKIIREI